MNLLHWLKGKTERKAETTKPKPAQSVQPEPPVQRRKPSLEELPSTSIFRPAEVTKQSALTVRAGRDASGRPVIREVLIDPQTGIVQEVLAEKLAGGRFDWWRRR